MEDKIFIDDDDDDLGDKTQNENNISDGNNNNNTGASSLSSKVPVVNTDSKNVNESNIKGDNNSNTTVEYDAASLNIMNNLACLYDSEATQEKDVSIFHTRLIS